jgi:hypothetical protein
MAQPPGGYYQQPQPGYYAPPPRKGCAWGWCLGCGCAAVLVILAAAGIFGVKYWDTLIKPKIEKEIKGFESTVKESKPTPTSSKPTAKPAAKPAAKAPAKPVAKPRKPQSGPQPTQAAAKRVALQAAGQSGWIAKVVYTSPDRQRMKVWIGPPASEFVAEVVLQWDSGKNRFEVEEKRGIPGM